MKFLLSTTAKPAPNPRGGLAASPPAPHKPTLHETNPIEYSQLTRLKCGDTIPGVLFVISNNQNMVFCDRHGWTEKANPKKGKNNPCNPNQSILEEEPPF